MIECHFHLVLTPSKSVGGWFRNLRARASGKSPVGAWRIRPRDNPAPSPRAGRRQSDGAGKPEASAATRPLTCHNCCCDSGGSTAKRDAPSPIALSSGKRFGTLQGHVAGNQVRPEPAAGQVFPVEILRPAVRIPDPEAPAFRNDLVAADVHSDHSPPSRKSVLRSCRNELCAILPLLAGETIVHCLYPGDVVLNPLKERETWTIST